MNHLQEYLNLNNLKKSEIGGLHESKPHQSSRSARSTHSRKASSRSMRSQSLAIRQKQIKNSQDLKLQEWYQGDLQGYPEKEFRAIKKELISLSSSGHEANDQVPLKLLSAEERSKVIGPHSGVLKARFVGDGFAQVIDMEAKYAHTPQAMTLKLILM